MRSHTSFSSTALIVTTMLLSQAVSATTIPTNTTSAPSATTLTKDPLTEDPLAHDQIRMIMPGATECASTDTDTGDDYEECIEFRADAGTEEECATPEQAAPHLVDALYHYNVTHTAEIAAVLTTIAWETGDMKFRRNKHPGRPGQGSSNMQMYTFNYEFAQTIPELKAAVDLIDGADQGDVTPTDVKDKVLDLVVDDEYNWRTAPWYYSTKCEEDVKKMLRTDFDVGFERYTLGCIGVLEMEEGRLAKAELAKKAFKLGGFGSEVSGR